ncbi:MAG: hypothetical protein K2X27_09215 [Candidatus Obscuribacterales bacterium]|nr:hypothetical protein [Candidatus Obscuribacterales bacterium]
MRTLLSFQKISILIALLLLAAPELQAAPKKKGKLIMMTPVFDTSLTPKPPQVFELELKHTQVVYPKDPSLLLHGDTGVVRLTATIKQDVLRSQIENEQKASTVYLKEHGVKAQFFVDFRKLEAKYAPEIAKVMESELIQARLKSQAEVARAKPLMDKELQARPPEAKLPPLPARADVNDPKSKVLDAELSQSAKQAQSQLKDPLQQFQAALTQLAASGAKMPAFNSAAGRMPELRRKALPSIPESSPKKPDLMPAEQELAEQLASAKLKAPDISTAALNAQMAGAKKLSNTEALKAQPAMDTILSYARRLPDREISKAGETAEEKDLDAQLILKWDDWHARFARIAEAKVLAALTKASNPAGADTVEITVLPDRHLTVKLTQSSNAAFDKAILEAFRALDGSPELAYPAGSRRRSLSFLMDSKLEGGLASKVKSQTAVGDREILRRH